MLKAKTKRIRKGLCIYCGNKQYKKDPRAKLLKYCKKHYELKIAKKNKTDELEKTPDIIKSASTSNSDVLDTKEAESKILNEFKEDLREQRRTIHKNQNPNLDYLFNKGHHIDLNWVVQNIFDLKNNQPSYFIIHNEVFYYLKRTNLFKSVKKSVNEYLNSGTPPPVTMIERNSYYYLMRVFKQLECNILRKKISLMVNSFNFLNKSKLNYINLVVCPETMLIMPRVIVDTKKKIDDKMFLPFKTNIEYRFKSYLNLNDKEFTHELNTKIYTKILRLIGVFENINMPMSDQVARPLYFYTLLSFNTDSGFHLLDKLVINKLVDDDVIDLLSFVLLLIVYDVNLSNSHVDNKKSYLQRIHTKLHDLFNNYFENYNQGDETNIYEIIDQCCKYLPIYLSQDELLKLYRNCFQIKKIKEIKNDKKLTYQPDISYKSMDELKKLFLNDFEFLKSNILLHKNNHIHENVGGLMLFSKIQFTAPVEKLLLQDLTEFKKSRKIQAKTLLM